jgi:hypothetical protein
MAMQRDCRDVVAATEDRVRVCLSNSSHDELFKSLDENKNGPGSLLYTRGAGDKGGAVGGTGRNCSCSAGYRSAKK